MKKLFTSVMLISLLAGCASRTASDATVKLHALRLDSLTIAEDRVYVHVIDVGQGLCVLASAPANQGPRRTLLYDAGGERGSTICRDTVRALLDKMAGSRLDLAIFSHFDYDHILNARALLHDHDVGLIVHTGTPRTGIAAGKLLKAIERRAERGSSVINAGSWGPLAGIRIPLGEAEVSVLSGWHDAEALPDLTDESERHNGVSIAVRLTYGDQAVLLAGDSVGRPDDADVCGGGEAYMVANAARNPLRSDVLVVSHHGAEDGSAECFLEAVRPTYVVFPSGDVARYEHPRRTVAERIHRVAGVPYENMFQTDFGTGRNEGREGGRAWLREDAPAESDFPGDDHVEIRLCRESGCTPSVRFVNPL